MALGDKAFAYSNKHTAKQVSYNPASGSVIRHDGHTYTGKFGQNQSNKVGSKSKGRYFADSADVKGSFSAAEWKRLNWDKWYKTWFGSTGSRKGRVSADVEKDFLKYDTQKAWNNFWKQIYPTGEGVDYSPMNYGNIGYAGSSAKSYSEYDFLKMLADQNTATNIYMNQANNDFAANQAKIQRDWEMKMSNTAHQREVKDLQAAGLNPILSANAGAAVPAGAAAGASNFAGADSSAINAIAGVIQAALGSSATTTAAALQANASMYGANQALLGSQYAADKSLEGKIYGADRTKYGMVMKAGEEIAKAYKNGKFDKKSISRFFNNISNWYSYRPGR